MEQMTARELEDQAKVAYQAGDFKVAGISFHEAATAYKQAGDGLMFAEMMNNMSVALLRDKRPQEAYDAACGSETVFAEAGDHRREGIAWANQASALEALNRKKEAIEAYTRAGVALEEAGEPEYRLEVMQLLASLYLRRFKLMDAIQSLQSGLMGIKNPTPRQKLMKKFLFMRL